MARTTPARCMRMKLGCQPLAAVVSDDETTFVCCGLHGLGKADRYRLCQVSEGTDSTYDYDELDLLDLIEVASRAMSTDRRLIESVKVTVSEPSHICP